MLKKILSAVFIFIAAVGVLVFYANRTPKDISVQREFSAPVEKVWALFADAEAMKKWWGPHGYFAPSIQSDLRPDGKFLIAMQAEGEGAKPVYNAGTYHEVVPNQRIASTMTFADEAGNPVQPDHYGIPGHWPPVTAVVIELSTPAEGKTLVKISEAGIPMIMSVFAKMGWEQQFEKMDTLLK